MNVMPSFASLRKKVGALHGSKCLGLFSNVRMTKVHCVSITLVEYLAKHFYRGQLQYHCHHQQDTSYLSQM